LGIPIPFGDWREMKIVEMTKRRRKKKQGQPILEDF
jgi:hypothetical protein